MLDFRSDEAIKLIAVKQLALKLMAEHGLIEAGWTFRWDSARKRYGNCSSLKYISLSEPLTLLLDDEPIRDIILHEIAHALVGVSHMHDAVWRAKAREIGCSGSRTRNDVKQLNYKYRLVCEVGHIAGYRMRKTSSRDLSCSACHPTFDERFLLKWETLR